METHTFKVIKHNEGDPGETECVPYKAKVTVHYTGCLITGEKFDSSRDRNQPFQFTVGISQVIRGWDEGIMQLKKGQKATIICPPEYGYGDYGAPPRIPPKAVLKFDVEVIDWEEY